MSPRLIARLQVVSMKKRFSPRHLAQTSLLTYLSSRHSYVLAMSCSGFFLVFRFSLLRYRIQRPPWTVWSTCQIIYWEQGVRTDGCDNLCLCFPSPRYSWHLQLQTANELDQAVQMSSPEPSPQAAVVEEEDVAKIDESYPWPSGTWASKLFMYG